MTLFEAPVTINGVTAAHPQDPCATRGVQTSPVAQRWVRVDLVHTGQGLNL